MPLAHSGFSTGMTGSPARVTRTNAAFAPRTTTTGSAPVFSAACAERATRGSPSCTTSCFGRPNRDEAPAASTTAATDAVGVIVAGSVGLWLRPAQPVIARNA